MFGEAYLDTDISDSNLSYRTTNLLFLYFCHVHWNQESDIFFVKEESILKKKEKKGKIISFRNLSCPNTEYIRKDTKDREKEDRIQCYIVN